MARPSDAVESDVTGPVPTSPMPPHTCGRTARHPRLAHPLPTLPRVSPIRALSPSVEARLAADAEFFGLEMAGDALPISEEPIDAAAGLVARSSFRVEPRLARPDGRLYGGSAVGVSVAVAEALTGRDAQWMTTQFVSTALLSSNVDIVTEILAPGRRTNQVRVTATTPDSPTGEPGEHVVFASLGATGLRRDGGLTGQFESRPIVDPPESSARWSSPFAAMADAAGLGDRLPALPDDIGFTTVIELRQAEVHEHPDPGPARMCMWVRRRDGIAITPAVAAYIADMVPMSVARAFGVLAMATSLDNTIRIGGAVGTEWALLDIRAHLSHGDYAHGVAHVWSEDGHLIATASQTASMRAIDLDDAPWVT